MQSGCGRLTKEEMLLFLTTHFGSITRTKLFYSCRQQQTTWALQVVVRGNLWQRLCWMCKEPQVKTSRRFATVTFAITSATSIACPCNLARQILPLAR